MKGTLFVFSLYGMAVMTLHDLERLTGCTDMNFIVFSWTALVLISIILVFFARFLVRWALEFRKEAHERLEWYFDLYPEERVPYSRRELRERRAVAIACRALGVTTHWYAGHGYRRQ